MGDIVPLGKPLILNVTRISTLLNCQNLDCKQKVITYCLHKFKILSHFKALCSQRQLSKKLLVVSEKHI